MLQRFTDVPVRGAAIVLLGLLAACTPGVGGAGHTDAAAADAGADASDGSRTDAGEPDARPSLEHDGGLLPDGSVVDEDGGASTDDGGATTDDGGTSTEDGGASTDDGGTRTDDGGVVGDDGGVDPDDGGMSTDDAGVHTDDGGAHTDDGGANGDDAGVQVDCRNDEVRERSCGLNHRGVQRERCANGAWLTAGCVDPDVCLDDSSRPRACGANGRGQSHDDCSVGQWQPSAVCLDNDVCTDGTTNRQMGCGLNARGTRELLCEAGQWTEQRCDDPDECVSGSTGTASCGANGQRSRTCSNGRWDGYGECSSCTDLDADRHGVDCVAGPDCDDADPDVYSGATDPGFDGKDQNCIARDTPDLDRIGGLGLGGSFGPLAATDGLLIVTAGASLRVYDEDQLTTPLGAVALRGIPDAVFADDHLAVAIVGRVLVVVDIANPAAPTVVAERYLLNFWGAQMAMRGHLFYLAHSAPGWGRVEAWDLSEPSAPVQHAELEGNYFGGSLQGSLLASEHTLVGRDSSTLYVFDAQTLALVRAIEFDTLRDIALDGPDLFVLTAYQLWHLDVSSEQTPELWLDGVEYDGLLGVDAGALVAGVWENDRTRLIRVDTATGSELAELEILSSVGWEPWTWSHDDRIYSVSERGVRAARLPATGAGAVTSVITGLGTPRALELVGSHAYLVGGGVGLAVLNVAAPEHPSIVQRLDLPLAANDLVVRNGLAYVAGHEGLAVVDVHDPLAPALLSFLEVRHYESSTSAQLVVSDRSSDHERGTFAFIRYPNFVAEIDATDPVHPATLMWHSLAERELGQLAVYRSSVMSTWSARITDDRTWGGIAYLTPVGWSYVQDTVRGPITGVATSGDWAFAGSSYQLHVFTLLDGGRRSPVATIAVDASRRLRVLGELLFVMGSSTAIDISDPFAPYVLGSSATSTGVTDMERQADLVFATTARDGLTVYRLRR